MREKTPSLPPPFQTIHQAKTWQQHFSLVLPPSYQPHLSLFWGGCGKDFAPTANNVRHPVPLYPNWSQQVS